MPPTPRPTNRLIHETSPYLLQHAHNPVDWYPWGPEALARARELDRPILLSIGYSACHWCHVMERESFEDEAIARRMNDQFICIKVDREERPDLDDIYMAATVAFNNGHGGWPMTVFLTPAQQPFFAGTYFPPTDRYGRPGFATILTRLAEAWQTQRAELVDQGQKLADHVRRQSTTAPAAGLGVVELDEAAAGLAAEFDTLHGGFSGAPKFPPSLALLLLLRQHRRSGDAHALEMVRVTLDRMARGGMYDQIGGGFHRYSTDERWLAPHFEKMLYDNALLTRAYVEAYQVTGEPFYSRIATEVSDYILREMTAPEGGFYSATDADSEGEEGRFFVWTPEQISAVLDPEAARRVCAYYDITPGGNWEGHGIPNTPRPLAEVAIALGITAAELQTTLDAARLELYAARSGRVPPALDDKILTSWNGLMIAALAQAARVLGQPRYRAAAAGAADFLLQTLVRPDGRLLRTYRAGKAHLAAVLEDYAYLCDGLIELYQAGGGARFLTAARRLAEIVVTDFAAADGGGFFSTARDHEALLVRRRDGWDGATPNPNALAAWALARLAHHFGEPQLRTAAIGALEAYGGMMKRAPRAFATALCALDFLLEGPVELALIGRHGAPDYQALRSACDRPYLPHCILQHGDGAEALSTPLLAGKPPVAGAAALYICENYTCQAPIVDAAAVAPALAAAQQRLLANRQTVLGR